jgi:tRNA pseudouridine55 synthase
MKKYLPPYMDFGVKCSTGTYVRSLAHDLGEKLGCGAHLDALVRTEIGKYKLIQARTLDDIESMFSTHQVSQFLHPMEDLLPEFPKIAVDNSMARLVRSGSDFCPDSIPDSKYPAEKEIFPHEKLPDIYRVFDSQEKLLAFATKKPTSNALHPFLVFGPKNSSC